MEGIIIYDRRQAGEDGRISESSCSEDGTVTYLHNKTGDIRRRRVQGC